MSNVKLLSILNFAILICYRIELDDVSRSYTFSTNCSWQDICHVWFFAWPLSRFSKVAFVKVNLYSKPDSKVSGLPVISNCKGGTEVALRPKHSLSHESSHLKSWDLVSKMETCLEEVTSGWVSSKFDINVPQTNFYWRRYFWSHLESV